MIIKSLQSYLMFAYTIILFAGYEFHLYEYYPLVNLLSLPILLIFALHSAKDGYGLNNPAGYASLVFISLLFITQVARVIFGYGDDFGDILKTLFVCLIYFAFLNVGPKFVECFFLSAFKLSIFASIFNVFLYAAGGKILLWEAFYGTRYGSFFFLHNIAAAIFGFQLIYSIYYKEGGLLLRGTAFFLALFSIFISFSKGTIVSVGLSVVITSVLFSKARWAIFCILVLCIFSFFYSSLIGYLEYAFPQFRFFTGLNERDEMWLAALNSIDHTGVFLIGGGEYLLHNMISSLGKEYLSTHNYFVDTIVSSGVFSFSSLLALVIIVFYGLRFKAKSKLFFAIAVYLVISANKSRFSLGGITLLSVMLSFAFAYAAQSWRNQRRFSK